MELFPRYCPKSNIQPTAQCLKALCEFCQCFVGINVVCYHMVGLFSIYQTHLLGCMYDTYNNMKKICIKSFELV